ncbi:glycosyltransferase family 39 protein [Candidatus Woesearchaeota archaeon]|nr:glycosyltransferase family 39 protein [Candidatus Woesearchaeota archaeon]
MGRKESWTLIAILALGFLLRIIAANSEWIDVDEGNYLYDAKLLSEEQKPFEDFYMKEVFYTSILSFFGEIFGFSLFLGRILSALFSLVTIIFVYKIGSLIYGKKTGLIAACIYAFIPFSIFWNVLVRESVLEIMLMTVSAYYIIRFTKMEAFSDMVLHALFLFMALLTRRSIFLFVLAELALLAYMYRSRLRFLLVSFFYGLIGVLMPLALLIFYSYAIDASFLKMLGIEFSPVTQAFSWKQFFGQRILLPYWLLREASYVILPLLIVLLYKLRNRTRYLVFSLLFAALFFSSFAFEYALFKFPDRMAQYPVPPLAFFILSMVYLTALFAISYRFLNRNYFIGLDRFIVLWVFSIIAFYSAYSRFHVVYIAEMLPAAVILITPFLRRLYEEKETVNKTFLVILLFGISLSAFFYVEYHGLNNKWDPDIAEKAALYIKENSHKEDEIFTPMTFVPIIADRKLVLNITHPLYYHFEGAGDADKVGVPSFKTIIEYMDRNEVKYVVIDEYVDVTYYSINPVLKYYIESNYAVEKEFDGIKILARKT